MQTFQDFQNAPDKIKWMAQAIASYMRSDPYKVALDADEYDAQRNVTINQFEKRVYEITGVAAKDPISANNHIASNFYHRLNTDRCQYSLGNGVSFSVADDDQKDDIKEALGNTFDTKLTEAAYCALKHGVSFMFVNENEYYVFPMTQFMPLWDEYDGTLKAGIRFWSLEWRKRPIQAVLYEVDGYTKYQTPAGKYGLGALEIAEEKRPYKQTIQISEADGEVVVGGSNYSSLPIVPCFASDLKQSTLVGMRATIDAYDMIQSGFANDLQDCAQIYWLIDNALGMNDSDIAKVRDRLLFQHMAVIDAENSKLTPYTQEVPYNAREACLTSLRNALYENFGVLDVHTVAAGATNDHIDAAYQPMDEEADAFEYQIIQVVQQVERIRGLEPAVPIFKRNKISNQKEQMETLMLIADHLDERTLLSKASIITVDEVDKILAAKDADSDSRFQIQTEDEEE